MKTRALTICNRVPTILPAIIFLAALGAETASSQEHNNSTDAIHELNVLFRREYAEARNVRLSQADPIIIVRGDFLVMLRGEKRIQGSTVHANYHDLKTISHGPLALFCILSNYVDKPLTEEHRKKLHGLRKALTTAADDLEAAFADPRQRSRQARLVDHCTEFIDGILKGGRCDSDELDALVDQLRPSLVLNAAEAARLRIDNYHAQMKRWRGELDDEAWERIHLIIPGAAMPRNNSLAVRYFAKLFEQAGEGNRIIYAESQFDESNALQLLGTHLFDSEIGTAFFDDSSRMKRDLLGPFANAYLDALDFEQLHESKSRGGGR